MLSYMYAYSAYLFFDFTGYTDFALAISHLFGVRPPENFRRPYLARNIADFWNRWHISLSHWFRDHVYMRLAVAAARGRWFRSTTVASTVAFFVSFGLMGLWHGLTVHFMLYGVFHAVLLSAHTALTRWGRGARWWGRGRWWPIASWFLTFNLVCFGFLLFSGHLIAR
jgi:membrane protein involved in D-alanine export